ncbi:pyridoxal 5'-phosphate synthase glutaminase subunit PdxT [Microlunatus soli]|uniref:Pyridoxal 5'-phosphate synthase subunit PdxT n=1 Tax=Microlunatus soli TaxID=630515 RepID=A0A1H2AFX0_9ACTN|nr:pyridoxal 5'-phosphate synthase glutaminase subunit PdxT [Microlunatus soli]SDT44861.1 pyridoxal phosphate synthase yaaE subunit [Microlunatus soli]
MVTPSNSRRRVGVLALQGDVIEHLRSLETVGAEPVRVRRPEDLQRLDGIVIPGGESTTIDKLARIFEVRDPLVAALREGLPAYGSCAGMILLADRITGGTHDQQTFGGLDITVRRNAFGRQLDSFETDLDLDLDDQPQQPFHAVFIRAPWVEKVGGDVRVVGRVHLADPAAGSVDDAAGGAIVAVRQEQLLATSFHPEVSGDPRLHAYFLRMLD